MGFKLKLSTQAQLDIWDIISWYEDQQAGLGERFNSNMNTLFLKISENPTLYSYYQKNFGKAIVKNFPYLVIFKVGENEVVVFTVIYGGRDPKLINKRIN
jgi:plasmid stabilization system protein ParE